MRVAEVDGHVQRGADPFVQGEFRSLVPGQAVAQEFGQVLHLVDDGLLDVFGVVPVGQVQQDREPGGALDERADGAFVAAAGDEIALPVARDRPVLDLRGSLRDHGHGFAETGFAALAALGSAGGSPLPHGAFQLLLEFAPGLQVDGLVDRLDARVHIPIIREVQPQPVGYLLRAPMPAQPGGDLVPQSRALGRLARFGAFEPVRGLLLGAVRLVTAGLGIPVALDLAADRAGVAAQQAGDGADRIAQTQTVRDLDALLLAQVARMEGLGFVHGGTIPVHQGFLVPSRGARPAVAPRLAGAFRDADRVRGLGEVHAFLVQQAHVLGASRLAHQLPRRIFDAVERPTVFPATVFVSVASGHLTLLAVGQVLQRSLEPAPLAAHAVGGSNTQLDGVLMVDPVFLQELTKISGNVTIPDGTVLTGDNTAEFLLNKVYIDYPVSMQDALFAQVAEQTVGSMFSNVDLTKLTKVAQLMGSMAEGRHFSMYAFDETAEKTISDAGFTAQTPSSEENPQVGVYVTEQNPSKMGWHIHRTSKVTRSTCDNDGSQTYHVEYKMTNTLESSQIGALTSYILGSGGQGVEKTLIYAPAGGSISNLKTSGGSVTESRQETLNGKTVYASNATIAPGESVTYSFDVTTSTKAVSDLTIDQTPMGWIDSGVTTDTAACSINKQ